MSTIEELEAAARERCKWSVDRRLSYCRKMRSQCHKGSKLQIVWLDGSYGDVKKGMTFIVDKHFGDTECFGYIPESETYKPGATCAKLYWWELTPMGYSSPIEQAFRKMSAG